MEFTFWPEQDEGPVAPVPVHTNISSRIQNTTEIKCYPSYKDTDNNMTILYCNKTYSYSTSDQLNMTEIYCSRYPSYDHESMLTYSIQYYGFYIIALFGCLSNLMLLIVLPLIKSTRNRPAGVFLWALTAADTFTLLSWRLYTLENDLHIQTGFAGCMAIGYIAHTSSAMSSLTTACATIFKFTAIVYPMKTRWSVNVNAARTGVVICAILSLVANTHSACVVKRCGASCVLDQNKGYVYLIVNTVIQIAICYVVVSLVVLILSVAIVMSLKRSISRLRKLSNNHVAKNRHKEEKQMTLLLLTVVVTFITLRLPYLFTWIGKAIFRDIYRNKDLTTHYHNVGRITGCCFMLAHAVNLWILLLNRRFKKDLWGLFNGIVPRKSNIDFDVFKGNGARSSQNK